MVNNYQHTAEDYHILFAGCIAKHDKLGIVLIDNVEEEDGDIIISYNSLDDYYRDYINDTPIDFNVPELGCKLYKDQCLYIGYSLKDFEENSSICYRKGINPRTLTIFDPLAMVKYFESKEQISSLKTELEFLNKIFNPPEYNWKELLDQVLSRTRLGAPLNENFMVSNVLGDRHIYRKNKIIGTVDDEGTIILNSKFSHFSEELNELGLVTKNEAYIKVS